MEVDEKQPAITAARYNEFGKPFLPGTLGVEVVSVDEAGIDCRMKVHQGLLAPNDYLHAGLASIQYIMKTSLFPASGAYGCHFAASIVISSL